MIRPLRRTSSGFSLVELLVVVAILGMLAGAATLSWRTILPRTRLNTDVRALAARLATARSDAISRNAEYQLVFDLEQDRYWVRPPFGEGGLPEPDESERAILFPTNLSQGVRFRQLTVNGEVYDESDGLLRVRFNPVGASDEALITLYHEPFDRFYTVEVLALTGLLRFHDGIYEREIPDDGDFN